LFDFDALNGRVGIGIMIEEGSQGKGYAQEALKVLIDYCFQILLLKQVFCNISASNERSLHLFRKMGFTEAGLKKSWNKIGQSQYEDEWIMQLIK
jgi:diamine N-acetyltransferase